MGAKCNLRYHVVLVSKYRNDVFFGIENVVLDAFKYAESKSSFKIERVAVEDGNYVHLVLRMSGTYSLSKTIARVKVLSGQFLWDAEEDHLKKFYWSGKRKLWSGGYYAATVGDVSIESVEAYLRKQGHWV